MQYYSAIKRNKCESVELTWMHLEPVMQSEVSQKEKNILTCIYMESGIKVLVNLFAGKEWKQTQRKVLWTSWGKERWNELRR